MKSVVSVDHDFGHGYLKKVAYEIRGKRLYVSLPHLMGGQWGNYVVAGMELAYHAWLAPVVPALRKELAKKFGGRKAATLLKEWMK